MKENNDILSEIGNRNPFTVPEGFFDKFAANMNLQITQPTQHLKRRRLQRIWISVAAVFVTAVTLGGVLFNYQQKNAYDQEVYETYLMAQIDDVSILNYYIETTSE